MIDRTTILRGPAVVTFNGATIFSKDDITDNFGLTTWAPESSAHGALDDRVDERTGEVSFTPVGEWEALALTALFPYRTTLIGASVFGADVPLVIHSVAGQKHTYYAAAVTQMPEIYFGSKKTSFGAVGFSIMGKNNVAWDTADSFRKIEAVPFPDATWAGFDPTKVITEPPTITWDTAAPTTFKAADGVTASFELALDDVPTDEDGVVDKTLGNVGIMARFQPIGKTEAEIQDMLKLQGVGNLKRGSKLTSVGFDLTIANSLGSLVIHKAAMVTAGFRFGRTVLRHGEIGFVAARTFTNGKRDPLWTLT